MSASDNTPKSFFSLPGEIRNEIYGLIAIPHSTPLSAYKGLFLSCRRIKTEMASECTKVFSQHLSRLFHAMQSSASTTEMVSRPFTHAEETSISPPALHATFSTIRHVRFLLPRSISARRIFEHDPRQIWGDLPAALLALTRLHLDSLTFVFHVGFLNRSHPDMFTSDLPAYVSGHGLVAYLPCCMQPFRDLNMQRAAGQINAARLAVEMNYGSLRGLSAVGGCIPTGTIEVSNRILGWSAEASFEYCDDPEGVFKMVWTQGW